MAALRARVLQGCVVGRSRSDAIVTSANPHLAGNANGAHWRFAGRRNVDGAVRAAAGPALAEAAAALGGKPPPVQSVVHTPPGALDAAHVLHAIVPDRLYGHGDAHPEELQACYSNVFRLSNELGCASVRLPALGCGVRGWPAALSAKLAFAALADFARATSPAAARLERVDFVLLDEAAWRAWAKMATMRTAHPRVLDQYGHGADSATTLSLSIEIVHDA